MVTKIQPKNEAPDVPGGAAISLAKPNENESLSDLAALAGQVDNPSDAGAPAAQQVAQATASADLLDVLTMARDMAAPMVESMGYLKPGETAQIWTKARLTAIAEPLVAIMERHGIGMAEAMSQYGPYFALIVGLWAPSMQTWAAIQANAIALTAPPTE